MVNAGPLSGAIYRHQWRRIMTRVAVNTLEAYEAELGVESITMAALIASHRHLRSLNLGLEDTVMKVTQQAQERGEKQAYDEAVKYGWLSHERAKTMSLLDFVEWVQESA